MEDSLMFDLNRIGVYNYPSLVFAHEIIERKLSKVSHFERQSAAQVDDILAEFTRGHKVISFAPPKGENDNYRACFIDMGSEILFIIRNSNLTFEVSGASNDEQLLDALMKKLLIALPPIKAKDENIIPINFWSAIGNSAARRIRFGTVPVWNESLALNYAHTTRDGLTSLMALRPPIIAGRMLLWHGIPGTGKSYMVRTLAQNWREWCRIHYIVDPEKFLGDANYMLSVIFDNEEALDASSEAASVYGAGTQTQREEKSQKQPWQLIIMEDANEFLGVDAKERTGQSLSRLLNMADGLVGQELNLLILITTNEPIEKIHPAIKRHGRCLSNIEFGTLSAEESEAWLKEYGAEMEGSLEGLTVAELYAQSREQRQVATKTSTRHIGFVRS